jgi:predicted flap endonuclease-1-like 5' DNA nuclease
VLGDFNEWSLDNTYDLKPKANGDFEGTFKIPAGRDYHFRYLVNGHKWANEKDADRFESSPLHAHIDNSVLSLPAVEEVIKVAAPKTTAKPAVKKEAAKTSAKKAEPKAAPAKKAPAKKEDKASKPATPAKKAAPAKKDDLVIIEGIGPKIAELLHKAGIDSFATLAATKKASLTAILAEAGQRYAMHDPSSWAQQAKLAASGKWEQLKALQAELK